MAVDLGRWIHALFTPNAAYGQTATPVAPMRQAPVTRVGNTYQGQALPAGMSSLLALSQDRSASSAKGKPQRQAKKYDKNLAARSAESGWGTEAIRYGDQIMGGEANRLMQMLFGDAEAFGTRMPKNDREADRLLDQVGYFDPRSGSIDERNRRAIEEWQRRFGLPSR